MKLYRHVLQGLSICTLSLFFMHCAPTPPASNADVKPLLPAAETYADSVAVKAYDALGGAQAFAELAALRFNFGFDRDGEKSIGRKHLWNKQTGDYRIEYDQGADSSYVVLFNVHTKEGTSYLNGVALGEEENSQNIEQAYRSFINDTYWLLAPMKMMDPGVVRSFAADSSDASTDVVKMTFEGVGLTPGDQYWMYVDKASGQLKRWSFVLQGNPEANPRAYDWQAYKSFETPAGTLTFSERKQSVGAPFALLTDGVAVYNEAPEGMMTNTSAILD